LDHLGAPFRGVERGDSTSGCRVYTARHETGPSDVRAPGRQTAKLIPEAATNVWTLEIDPEKRQLIYFLERHGEPRYRAVFEEERLAA
jgi:hypothetical protein